MTTKTVKVAKRHAVEDAEARPDINSVSYRIDLHFAEQDLIEAGDALAAAGDRIGAIKAYRAGFRLSAGRAVEHRDNIEVHREISILLNKIGDLLAAEGDRVEALRYYDAAFAILTPFASAARANTELHGDLIASLNKFVRMLEPTGVEGDRAEALTAYLACLAIAERLTAADPGSLEWCDDLVDLSENVPLIYPGITRKEASQVSDESNNSVDLVTLGGDYAGTMAEAADYSADARTLSDDQLRELVQKGEAAASELTKRGKASANKPPRPVGRPRADERMKERDEARLGILELEVRQGINELKLPPSGFTSKADADAAARLATTVREVQKLRKKLGRTPMEMPEQVKTGEAMASAFRRSHDKETGELIAPSGRGRPRRWGPQPGSPSH